MILNARRGRGAVLAGVTIRAQACKLLDCHVTGSSFQARLFALFGQGLVHAFVGPAQESSLKRPLPFSTLCSLQWAPVLAPLAPLRLQTCARTIQTAVDRVAFDCDVCQVPTAFLVSLMW